MEDGESGSDLVCASCALVFSAGDLDEDIDGFCCPECGSIDVVTPDEWDDML